MGFGLYDYQLGAIRKMKNGCILAGGVGSGKSRTAIGYYFVANGGDICSDMYEPMDDLNLPDLYIITIAKKRDSLEWEGDLIPYLMSSRHPENHFYSNKVVVDSWNNIGKYKDIENAFFIFDENKLSTMGKWSKTMIHIAKHNQWIILSATPGDKWSDYITVFVANGFYKNKSEFGREHIVYSPYKKYPSIDRYLNTAKLNALRRSILVDMDFKRDTVQHHEDIYVNYDISKYKEVSKTRFSPFTDLPIKNASEYCLTLRRVVNEAPGRSLAVLDILERHKRAIIFYNFNYELGILRNLPYSSGTKIAQWNGLVHEPLPEGEKWVYLVNYGAAEGWNCITADTIIFYSQNYSYKTMVQAAGRIDRVNTDYKNLYYYHLKSRSGIDTAISRALSNKKKFNENKFAGCYFEKGE